MPIINRKKIKQVESLNSAYNKQEQIKQVESLNSAYNKQEQIKQEIVYDTH